MPVTIHHQRRRTIAINTSSGQVLSVMSAAGYLGGGSIRDCSLLTGPM
jgi:hypothetical protein